MNQNIGKALAFLAVLGGLGSAYYFTMVKPKKEEHSVEQKTEKPAETPKEATQPVAEAPKEAAPEAKPEAKVEEKKEEVKAEEPAKTDPTPTTADGKVDFKDETLAATIEGLDKKVTIKDAKTAADMLPPQMRQVPFTTLYPILVRQAVDFVLLEHEAIKEGFDKKPEILKTIEDHKRAVLVAAFLEKEVEAKVSEEVLQKKYEEIKKMIPADEKEFEIAHILLKDEAAAKALIEEIKAKKTTFEAALDKSIDEKTKTNGGRIGFVKRMEIAPEFFDKVTTAKDGDIVTAPLNLGKAGSSVIRVVSRRPLQAPEFEKVKGEIRKALMPELSMDIIKGIKAEAGLKLFNLEGKEIPERTEEELKKIETETPSTVDASKLSPDFVCATYKDGKITLKDVKSTYDGLPDMLKMLPFEKIYELVLIRVCNDRIISGAAEKAGVGSTQKVKDQMKTEAKLVIQEAYLKTKAEAAITETDLKADYNAIVKNMAEKNEMEYRLRHIAFKTEDEAKAALKKLKAGESFDTLVTSSIDEQTKDKKGELGYVRKQMLPAEIFEPISKTAKGTLVNQVCKLNDNLYSLIRVEDKRAVTPPTFEQMKDRLKSGQTAKKAVGVLENLRSKFKIHYENIPGLPSSEKIEKVVKEINAKMTQVLEGKEPMDSPKE